MKPFQAFSLSEGGESPLEIKRGIYDFQVSFLSRFILVPNFRIAFGWRGLLSK